jgi:hypothetical protein
MKERYTKTKWVDGKTCVNAANLNKIESGIENLYRNAVGESQLQEGDGISLNKDPMTGNITIGIKAENDLVSSSAVGRIEVVNSMPANPDPNCMYFVKDLDTGKFDLVFGGINLLSTISSADVPLAKLEGEVEVIDNGDGTFSVSYDGEEGTPEIVVYFNGVPREDPEDFILVPGVNTFEVHVRIEGYEEIVEEYEIEYTPRTATPEITYDPETYIITVTGDGEIKFYIDGNLTELSEGGQYIFERGSEEITHTLTATAQEESCEISNTATLEVTIPALPELEGIGEINITAVELYSRELTITYSGDVSDVEISVEGEGIEEINEPTRNISKKIRLPEELGPHSFVVTLTAPGYQPWIYETSWTLKGKRENPTITSLVDPETGDLTITVINSTFNSITINGVENTFSESYTIQKTYEDQHIVVVSENRTDSSTPYLDSSDQVREEFDLEAKKKTPSQAAEFNFWLDGNGTKAYFTATGPGIRLYVNGINEEVSTTQEFNRPEVGEKDMIIPAHTYYAETLQQGEQYKETITRYEEDIIIPSQVYSDPVIAETTEEDKTCTVDFVGSSIKKAYLDITEIELPYTVNKIETKQTLTFRIITKEDYKIEKEYILTVEIPALVQKTNTPTITQNGLTVTATGDGNILLYVDGVLINGSTTYTFTKTDEQTEHTVTATAQEDGKEISEVASLTITVPALVYAEEPTFNWAQSNTMSATCRDHNVVLKLNGKEVENPYQVEPEEEELVLNFSAYTIANGGEDRNSAEKEYEGNPITIPALGPYVGPEEPTVDPELTGQIAYNGPDETGKINITYSGEEDVTFTVILNGQPAILGENNELQLQEGINNIGVRVGASGYSDKSATFTINWPE